MRPNRFAACPAPVGPEPATVSVLPAPIGEPSVYDVVEVVDRLGRFVPQQQDDKLAIVYASLGIVVLSASSVIIATAPAGHAFGNAQAIDTVNRYNDDRDGWLARCAANRPVVPSP